jgi:hypothetical protein
MLKDLSFLIKKLYNPYNSFLSQASGLLNIVIRFYKDNLYQACSKRDETKNRSV